MLDLNTITANAAVQLLATGQLSRAELLELHIERIQHHNPELNLVVALDLEPARKQARAADDAHAAGNVLGPLHGLPMTIKDSFETEGLVTTSGAPELASYVPATDADAVAALKSAGAIVFGKTNLPLYAGDFQTYNAVYGLSRNPWNPERTTGGSSGGAAAAVATGMTLLELGSDIGGSIRNPCHYNGVFGHKPSFGVVPHRGHIPGPPGARSETDLGVMGPIGRSVADLELAMGVLTAGGVHGVRNAALPPPTINTVRQLRVAVIDRHDSVLTSADCRAGVRRVADALATAGAEVREAGVPRFSLTEQYHLYLTLLNAAMAPGLPPVALDRARATLSDHTAGDRAKAAARGLVMTHADWCRADEMRHQMIAAFAELFDAFDVIVAPIAPTTAFPHQTEPPFHARTLAVDGETIAYIDHFAWAGFATLPLLPATAVPAGLAADRLPVGVQIVGPRYADRTTLAVAAWVEARLGGFIAPPLA